MPKVGFAQDTYVWRLSFSQSERILSHNLNEKARKTYIAVKLLMKKHLKKNCSFLKTYHLKTIFLYYMEKNSAEYWQMTCLEDTVRDLLDTLCNTLESGVCPHFFIPDVNLWGEQILGGSVNHIHVQSLRGCQLVREVMRKGLSDFIIPVNYNSVHLLESVYSKGTAKFYIRASVLVIVTELLLIACSPWIFLFLAVMIQTGISWILGMAGCLPVILLSIPILAVLNF